MPRWLVAVLAGCGCLLALFVVVVVAVVAFGSFLLPSIEDSLVEDLPEKLISEEFPEAEPFLTPEKTEVERKPVTIRVTGTSGVSFLGAYCAVSCGSIEGVIPEDFDAGVYQDFVTVNVQKQDEGNRQLTLQVLVGGEVVKEQSTTEPGGVVDVTVSPEDT